MKGNRPLTLEEIDKIGKYFEDGAASYPSWLRDYTMIILACYTGLRISELLSIKVKDVCAYGKIVDDVYIQKGKVKGKKAGRTAKINSYCKELVKRYLDEYDLIARADLTPDMPLFPSQKGGSIQYRQAYNIFMNTFKACKFTGRLGTHTGRKTFAKIAFEKLGGNLIDLQKLLGHTDIKATVSYCSFNTEKINKVLDEIKFTNE